MALPGDETLPNAPVFGMRGRSPPSPLIVIGHTRCGLLAMTFAARPAGVNGGMAFWQFWIRSFGNAVFSIGRSLRDDGISRHRRGGPERLSKILVQFMHTAGRRQHPYGADSHPDDGDERNNGFPIQSQMSAYSVPQMMQQALPIESQMEKPDGDEYDGKA